MGPCSDRLIEPIAKFFISPPAVGTVLIYQDLGCRFHLTYSLSCKLTGCTENYARDFRDHKLVAILQNIVTVCDIWTVFLLTR